MILGAHMPTNGGLHRALERGLALEVQAVQIFTRNQLQWRAKPLDPESVSRFRALRRRFASVFSHGSYLMNLATPDGAVFAASWSTLADELERAAALGLKMLVVHPGSHRGSGVARGIRRVARAVALADRRANVHRVRILFETTAGQGHTLGGRFEELRDLLDATHTRKGGAGICVDTCHVFAAGYELRGEEHYAETMAELDRIVGLGAVRAIHANDSHGTLGSHLDRHAHIGEGRIGRAGFRNLMRDPHFASVPICLETPKGEDLAEDRVNLAVLRRLGARRER